MAAALVLKENRHLVRRELIYYLKVTDRQTRQELGRLGDIHTEGMLLLSPQPLPVQAVYELFLELPKSMAGEIGYLQLSVEAQALWNRQGPANYYENGLRFLSLSEQTQGIIDRLTEVFAMPSRAEP